MLRYNKHYFSTLRIIYINFRENYAYLCIDFYAKWEHLYFMISKLSLRLYSCRFSSMLMEGVKHPLSMTVNIEQKNLREMFFSHSRYKDKQWLKISSRKHFSLYGKISPTCVITSQIVSWLLRSFWKVL